MNGLQQEAISKYSQLLQPTPDLIKVFRTLYNGEMPQSPFSGGQQTNTPFGSSANNASSLFRSAAQTNSVFGQNTGGSQSIFASQGAGSNVFGAQNSGSTAAQSIFAQANQSVFGNNQAQPTANPTSIFASASQKLFGSPTSQQFGQPQVTSPFANTTAQSPSNIFQKQDAPTQNVFGQNPSSVFSQANPESFFGQKPAASSNVFGQTAPSSVFAQSSGGVFGQSTSNVFEQKAASNDRGVYSLMEELSAEELESFQSDHFTLGHIPEVPPPHSLCT